MVGDSRTDDTLILVVCDHRGVEAAVLEGDRQSGAIRRCLAEIVAGNGIVVVAVVVPGHAGDLGAQHAVREAARIGGGPYRAQSVIAEGELDLSARVLGRLGAYHADGAGEVVATEKGSLRAAQYFYPFDVEGIVEYAGISGQGYAVHRDARLGVGIRVRVEEGDAAYGDLADIGDQPETGQHHIGRDALQIRQVVGAVVLEQAAVHRGDGDGYVLNALLPLLCGDDDFFEYHVAGFALGQDGGWGADGHQKCRQQG